MKSFLMGCVFVACFLFPGSRVQAPVGDMQTFGGCGLEGDAKLQQVRNLNLLKNRYTPPNSADMNPRVALAAILAPGSDLKRWSETQGAVITGYVIDVKPGGPETVNCGAKDPQHTDTHIELALNLGDTQGIKHMIVEVTPRGRAIMASKGIDWSTGNLHRTMVGHKVQVTGWMMLDREHCNAAENTNPGNAKNWRATCWEIHPVSGLAPVPNP